MKHLKQDLTALALLALLCVAILAVTFMGVLLGSWFADIVYRAGAHGNAAEWISHMVGLALTIIVVLTLLGRLFTREWWFLE